MGNKKQTEVLDTIIDCLIINNSITRKNLIAETGLSYVTVKKWLGLIQKIQDLPRMGFDGKFLYLDMKPVEEIRLENAIAFSEEITTGEQEVKEKFVTMDDN
jgi:hypothetical protein